MIKIFLFLSREASEPEINDFFRNISLIPFYICYGIKDTGQIIQLVSEVID